MLQLVFFIRFQILSKTQPRAFYKDVVIKKSVVDNESAKILMHYDLDFSRWLMVLDLLLVLGFGQGLY